MKKLVSLLVTVTLAGSLIIVLAGPAFAFCHSVSFTPSEYNVMENAGQVELTITRVIFNQGCTGTVDYNTIDGTAKAGSDYKATSGQVMITDPMQKTIKIQVPIIDDKAFEGDEKFSLHFKHTPGPPGSAFETAEQTATVTIQDNDPSPPPTTAPPKASPTPTTTASPTATAAPTTGASPGTPLVIAGSATPSGSPTPLAGGKTSEKKGASTGLIVGVIALIIAASAGAGLWFLRKAPG